MKYEKISSSLFVSNREKFMSEMQKNSMAIFNSNDVMPTNADGTMPFRQNNDLFWLSGVDQEESILLLFPNHEDKTKREVLFLKETNQHIAIWEGQKLSKKDAFETSGISTVYWLSEFEEYLKKSMLKASHLYLNQNIHSRAENNVQTRDDRFRIYISKNYADMSIKDAAPIMHKLRSIKSIVEVNLIKKACDITENGFRRILPFIKPGVMEYEIEAELIHEFINNQSRGFAYQPIIGSGINSCVLHYIQNNSKCLEDEILLMDFGAEYANYASDMTRTVPVSGRFTLRQRAVYDSVLHVMKEATKMLRPGTMFADYNKEIGKIMQEELIKLGLLDRHDVLKQDDKNPLYKKYFMHGTSHYLGLDVHDVGSMQWPMQAGMVFTCEPGIYIPEEKIGIRLENDILVTDNNPDDLMKNIPIDAEEIEMLMNL